MASLFDLTPLAQMLMVVGLVVLLPLAWIWKRHPDTASRRRALTLLLVFLTFDLIVFGAFTRLSDSGLGCPDWPGCYGSGTPLGASAEIAAAQSALPDGPVTFVKAWIEMLHRYLASAVGALILFLALWSWRHRQSIGSPWPATLALVWVCVQGAFGALTVTLKLFPAIVTMHLMGGILLLVILGVQVAQDKQFVYKPLPDSSHRLLWLSALLLGLQIALGAWVSTNYAVLACQEFPTCQGSWWPEMDFAQGFELWRHLGVDAAGSPIGFAALTAIHYTHRLMAYLVALVLTVLTWRLWQSGWRRAARYLGALLLFQLLTGLSNVVLGWPMLAALLHTAGAAALALLLSSLIAVQWTPRRVQLPSGPGMNGQRQPV